MFSKAKDRQGRGDNNPPVKPEPEGMMRQNSTPQANNAKSGNNNNKRKDAAPKPSGVPSLISADVRLEGNLESTGEVQLDGMLEGNIKAASLIIGEKAGVKGEVVCEAVTIRGRVEGLIRARSVALASTAHIEGDIIHSSLSVEPGAHFDGNCRHAEDPLSDDAARIFDRPAGGQAPSAPRPAPADHPSTESDVTTMSPADAEPVRHNNTRPRNPAFPPSAPPAPAPQPQRFANGSDAKQAGPGSSASSAFMNRNRSPLR